VIFKQMLLHRSSVERLGEKFAGRSKSAWTDIAGSGLRRATFPTGDRRTCFYVLLSGICIAHAIRLMEKLQLARSPRTNLDAKKTWQTSRTMTSLCAFSEGARLLDAA
jgi:hypothetical protein